MQKLVSSGVWAQIEALAARAKARLAAIAFVSSDRNLKFSYGDLLIVDASDAAIRAGATSADVLARAKRRGAEVLSVRGLHAKVLVLGKTAAIGSANLSTSSADRLIELSLLSDQRQIVNAAKSFIYQLAEKAEVIDATFLKRILAISVVRNGGFTFHRTGSKVKISEFGRSTWLVNVSEMNEGAFPEELATIDIGFDKTESKRTWRNSALSWLRFVGKGAFRLNAKEGDDVIQIWKPLGGENIQVRRHAAVLLRQEETATRTRFYVEGKPGDGRRTLTLKQFRGLLKRHGFRGHVGPSSCRQIDSVLSDELFENWSSR